MVVLDCDLKLKAGEVVCKDDAGHYVTTKARLDTGLADPNRYSSSKRVQINEESK